MDQGWNEDINYRALEASHAWTFAMHLSLFVSLQDMTPKMRATGICLGSHYCTEINGQMEDGCIQVTSLSGNDIIDGKNGT